MKHVFGCATTETGEFYNQEVDGIIGFGSTMVGKNSGDPPNILSTEHLEGRIKSLVFSICLGHNGGEMTFGDWNKFRHLDDNKKLKDKKNNPNRVKVDDVKLHEDHKFILTERGFAEKNGDPWDYQYKVPLLGIYFDGQKIDYPYKKMNRGELTTGDGAFFDTGTTYVYTSHKMFDKIKQRFNQFCSRHSGHCGGESRFEECYSISSRHKEDVQNYFKTFPLIEFSFEGDMKYRWYPYDYLIKNGDLDQYCVGIKALKDMILGAVFMRNYDVLFDKSRKLIGFARSDCSGAGDVPYYDENGDDILEKVTLTEKAKGETTSSDSKTKPETVKGKKHSHHHHSVGWREDEAGNGDGGFNWEIVAIVAVLLGTFLGIVCLIAKYLLKKDPVNKKGVQVGNTGDQMPSVNTENDTVTNRCKLSFCFSFSSYTEILAFENSLTNCFCF